MSSIIQLQFRRGPASQWTSVNPILADGELAIESDTRQFKIGNGVTAWNSLAYGGLVGPAGAPGTISSIVNYDMSFNANIFVGGDTSLNGRLKLSNDASFNSNLYVEKDVSLGGNLIANKIGIGKVPNPTYGLDVVGGINMTGGLYVNGNPFSSFIANDDLNLNANLFVSKDASLSGKLYVGGVTTLGGDTSLNANLYVGSDASFNGKLYIVKDTSMKANLYVGKDVSMSGKLYVGETTTLGGVTTLGGDASLNANLFVGKDVSMSGKLYVGGVTTLGGDASLNANLVVGNALTVNGYISTDALIQRYINVVSSSGTYTADFNNGTTIYINAFSGSSTPTLAITNLPAVANQSYVFTVVYSGAATSTYFNTLTINGVSVPLTGSVSLVGTATYYVHQFCVFLKDTVTLGNNLVIQYFSSSSNPVFTSPIINGDASLNANLFVGKDVSMSGKLYIARDSSMNGNLSIGRDISFGGNLYGIGNANINGNIGVGTNSPTGKTHIYETIGTIAGINGMGSLVIEHANAGGNSSIVFPSASNKANEYAYLQYNERTNLITSLVRMDLSYQYVPLSANVSVTTSIINNGSIGGTFNVGRSGGTDVDNSMAYVVNPNTAVNKYNNSLIVRQNQTNGKYIYLQSGINYNKINETFSFSAWIRPTIVTQAGRYLTILDVSSKTESSSIIIRIDGNSSQLNCSINDNTSYRSISTTTFTVNTWYHIVFTYDGANGKLYINGVNESNFTGGPSINYYDTVLLFRRWDSTAENAYAGYVNKITIDNYVYTATEISNLYNQVDTINNGILQIGIEKDPAGPYQDSIVLMPAAGNGYVGVNTKTPIANLDISGSMNVSGTLNLNGNFYANNPISLSYNPTELTTYNMIGYQKSVSTTTTLPSTNGKEMANITLNPGVWAINAQINPNTTVVGTGAYITLSITTTSAYIDPLCSQLNAVTITGRIDCRINNILSVQSETKYYFNAWVYNITSTASSNTITATRIA